MNLAAIYFIIGVIGIILSGIFLSKNSEIQACKGNFTAIVNRVIDGDTLEMKECSKHVRLSLANTPEIDQEGWAKATNFTKNLCKVGSSVDIQQDNGQPYDVYGRIVAVVYCQNKNLNEELIKNNLAIISTQYCSRSIFYVEGWAWNNGCSGI
jgi:micrococcal nuclease